MDWCRIDVSKELGRYVATEWDEHSVVTVINFVEKDIAEMFPKWEFDVEDTPAENIIKLMFVKKPWKWTLEHWEVTGTRASEEAPAESSEEVHTVARSEVTTTVGGLTKEDIKTMFKEIVDAMREGFGTCLKEIKGTGTSSQNTASPPKNTLEPGSESVNGTNAGRKRLPEDIGPDIPADDSSSKDKAPEPSLVLLDKNHSTVLDLQKEDAKYQDKRDAALALCRAKSDRTRRTCCLTEISLYGKPHGQNDLPISRLVSRLCRRLTRRLNSLEPFTFERPDNIPPARAGDCGVYTLKYIECHALGIEFTKKEFAKSNGKTMRDKMAWIYFKSFLTRMSS
ncbi:unnamed protein product [Brassica rapa subsp. narinosa]|uniref:Ubiquitin-like protease family profile domain-containing protein n=2 Tax=Brassica TaxID=3705 RepID=A0A3P5YUD2_BRACM|nr:unnamed protein product [Brassica napus]VDC71337.1 unnamed protein product [Brassica rapa]